jgi:hypothetical protein
VEEEAHERDAAWHATEVDKGLSLLSNGTILAVALGISKVGSGMSLSAIGDVVMILAAVRLARAAATRDLRRTWTGVATGLVLVVVIPPLTLVLPGRPTAIASTIVFAATAATLLHALALQAGTFGGETAKVWSVAEGRVRQRIGFAAAAGVAMLTVVPAVHDDSFETTAFGIGFGSSWASTLLLLLMGAAAIWAYVGIRHPYRVLRAAAQFARNHPAEPTSTTA